MFLSILGFIVLLIGGFALVIAPIINYKFSGIMEWDGWLVLGSGIIVIALAVYYSPLTVVIRGVV